MEALMANGVHVASLLSTLWEWCVACPPLAFIAFAGIVSVVIGVFAGLKSVAHL